MAILNLNAVLNYGEIAPNSKKFNEAESILAAKLIITFRVTRKTEKLKIFLVCLKTSAM